MKFIGSKLKYIIAGRQIGKSETQLKYIEKYMEELINTHTICSICKQEGLTGTFSENYICSNCWGLELNKKEDKRKFDTGAVRDAETGKEDFTEGVSWLALKRFAQYMDSKAVRYGRGNWRKGIPPESYIKSLARHLQKFLVEWEDGICEEHDDHLSAMVFNLFGIMHELELHKNNKGRFEIKKNYTDLYPLVKPDKKV